MRALTVGVTYILFAPLPIISIWLSNLGNRALHIAGLVFGALSAIVGFAGLYSIVSDILTGKSYGDTATLIAMSIVILLLTLGLFLIATAYGILRNYLNIFRNFEELD